MDLEDAYDAWPEESFLDLFQEDEEEGEQPVDLETMLPPPADPMPPLVDSDASSTSIELLSLPSEMLTHVASFLSTDQLRTLRLSSKGLCRASDGRMMHNLHLCTSSVTLNSKGEQGILY